MTDKYSAALGRALAYCSADPAVSWEKFLSRAAWELFHVAPKGYAECALLLVPKDGPFLIGRSHSTNKLAAESIFGLLVEHDGRQLALRVKDHARDSFRFFDDRIRSSVILRLEGLSRVPWCRDGVLWLGLPSVASPAVVADAEGLGRAVSEWLEVYAPVLNSIRDLRTTIRALESDGRHYRSLAHDARGPLSAVRYVVGELLAQAPSDDLRALSEQMTYLEQLMESFNGPAAPHEVPQGQKGSVRDVCVRVCQRYAAVVAQAPLTVRFQEEPGSVAIDDGGWSTMPSLHLERVLSNMVGNAVRHTPEGIISITLRTTQQQVYLSVRDSGAGMPAERVAELNGENPAGVASAHGWGLGIAFCKERIRDAGGSLRFSSKEGEGTTVEISLPRRARKEEGHRGEPHTGQEGVGIVEQPGEIAEESGGALVDELLLVDDDAEQLTSVSRLFAVKRIPTRTFESVTAALEYLRQADPARHSGIAVLCDTHMPDGGSERLLKELKGAGLRVNVAVASGDLDEDTLYRLAALGAQAFFAKPIEVKEVVGWLEGV